MKHTGQSRQDIASARMQIVGLFFGLCVALAAADNGWRVKQEYTFAIEGRSLAGIPQLKHQYSGVHFRGNLLVQSQHAALLVMALKDATFTKVHANMDKGWWHPLPNTDEELKRFQDLPLSGQPFVVRIEQGKVARIVVSSKTPTWEINFIQAIVSHLQHNTDAKPESKRANMNNEPMEIYTVMEDSIVGRCEVMYEISPLAKPLVARDNQQWTKLCGKNKDFMEVIKTWNYTNCERLEQSNYGISGAQNCIPGSNECGRFWSRSSLTRTIGCGERNDMIRLNTISSSQILASLKLQSHEVDESKPNSQASLGSYLNMTLLNVQPFTKRIIPPTDPVAIDGLKYQYESFEEEEIPAQAQLRKPRSVQRRSRKHKHQQKSADLSDESKKDKEPDNSNSSSEEKQPKKADKKKVPSMKRRTTTTAAPDVSHEWNTNKQDPEDSDEDDSNKFIKNVKVLHEDEAEEASLDLPPVLPFSPFTLAHQDNKARACLVQQFKETVQEITKSMGPQEAEIENIEKIQLAVQMCRSMTYGDLNTAVNTVIEDRTDKTGLQTKHKLLRDIVMMCGSNPSFLLIKNWVETGAIQGEEAAQVISALPSYMLKPSRKLLQKFFEMVQGEIGAKDQRVKIATLISFSHVLRITCADQQKQHSFIKQCQPLVKNYLNYMNEKAKSSKNSMRSVYLTALGNAGFTETISLLASFARDQKATPYQRVSAIVAMRHLVFIEPKETSRVLLKIYHSTTYPNSVRVAALSMLLYSQPQLYIWQRIAVSTWFEPSMALQTFIYSSIRSIAANKDPVNKQMARFAATVLPLVKVAPLGPYRPYNLVRSSVTKEVGEVISEQLSWSLDPSASNLYFRQIQRIGELSKIQIESDMWIADVDGLLIMMNGILFHPENTEEVRPPIPNLPFTTHWIRSTLNIAQRALPQIEGHFSFKMGKLHQRFLPFDDKSLPFVQQQLRKFIEEFRFGEEMLYQKNGHQTIWISSVTEVGLPTEFKIEVPWMFRGRTISESHQSRGSFSTQFKAMASTEFTSELSVFTPHDCMRYIVGINSFTNMQVPLTNVAIQKLQGAKLNLSFTPLTELGENLIFSQNSTPYTAQQDMLSLTPLSTSNVAAKIKIAPELKSKTVSGSTDSFRLEYASESPNHRWAPEPHWILNYPSLWRGIESSQIKIWANTPSPVTASFSIRQARLEDGNLTFVNSTSPTWRHQKLGNDPLTTTEWSTTIMTTESSTSMSSTTAASDVSQTTPMYTVTTEAGDLNLSDYDDGQADNSTKLERMKLKIISSNVNDPIGSFNASEMNLFDHADMSARQEYLLTNVLSSMESGQATVLSIALAVNNSDAAQYQSFFVMGQGRAREYHRMGAFFISDVDKYRAALTGVVSTPKVPLLRLRNMMDAIINSTLVFDMRISNNNDVDDIVAMKGHVSRTSDQKNYIYNHTSSRECFKSGTSLQPDCYRLLQKAAYLDRYNLTMFYNDGARRHGLVAQHYFGIAKHILFPHLSSEDFAPDVTPTEATDKTIKIIAEVHPQTQGASLWMRTPTEETEFNNIPLNSLLYQLFRINPLMGLASRSKDTSYCSMEQKKFVTFDRSMYTFQMSNNWHVLAKDCSGRSRFAILTRNITSHTEVMVNLDNYKVIHFMPGSVLIDGYRVDMNREQLAETYDRAGTQMFELTFTKERAFNLRLPAHGLSIVYDTNALLIQPSALLRGRMCGMCGNFNGQMEDDYSVPSGAVKQDAAEFAKSWSLPLN